jgi:hypothetical protein
MQLHKDFTGGAQTGADVRALAGLGARAELALRGSTRYLNWKREPIAGIAMLGMGIEPRRLWNRLQRHARINLNG